MIVNPNYWIEMSKIASQIHGASNEEITRLKNIEFALYSNRFYQGDLSVIAQGGCYGQSQSFACNPKR